MSSFYGPDDPDPDHRTNSDNFDGSLAIGAVAGCVGHGQNSILPRQQHQHGNHSEGEVADAAGDEPDGLGSEHHGEDFADGGNLHELDRDEEEDDDDDDSEDDDGCCEGDEDGGPQHPHEGGESSSSSSASSEEEEGPARKRRRSRGGGIAYPATRKPRTRKLAPATREAYAVRDAAVRNLALAESAHGDALTELDEARRRVRAALERVKVAEEEIVRAEEGVVDAELDDPSNRKWNDMYQKLVRFREENGHCNVEQLQHKRRKKVGADVTAADRERHALGRFVALQRASYKIPVDRHWRSLHRKPYRIKALERIGFTFELREQRWMENYRLLVDYREKYGDIDVAHCRNKALKLWLQTQFEQYQLYRHEDEEVRKTSRLNAQRASLLEEVGVKDRLDEVEAENEKAAADLGGAAPPRPPLTNANDALWENRFAELVRFKERHGNLEVREEGTLKMWLQKNRKALRRYREGKAHIPGHKMTEERAKKLEGLGLVANPREAFWMDRYRELQAFSEEHGNCLVPRNYKNKQLAKWVSTMRTAKRQQQDQRQENDEKNDESKSSPQLLTSERLKLLNDLNFCWDPSKLTRVQRLNGKHAENWMQRYEELRIFQEANDGSCHVPHHVNTTLNQWCYRQRREWKYLQDGKPSCLTQYRIELLEAIGFWDKGKLSSQNWDERYQELLKYKEEHGDCLVTNGHQLFPWVLCQRRERKLQQDGKASSLNVERLELLTKAGFVFQSNDCGINMKRNSPEMVVTGQEQHGHCRMPVSRRGRGGKRYLV